MGKIELQSNCFYWTSYLVLSGFLLDSFISVVEGTPGQTKYAVVFDAGSTGTRVNAFEFHTSQSNQLVLGREFFFPVEPGLSSYHEEPQEAAASIEMLLDEVRTFVPEELRSSTPLVLKGTAGLRLISEDEANNLMNIVKDVFSRSGFHVPDKAVEIMDGVDEGIFSWFTVNILLGHLNSVHLGKNTVASLDLGGGSTQVTFGIKNPKSTTSLAGFIHRISTPEAEMDVFSNSYLNLGVEAVRHAVFTCGKTADELNYESECINPSIKSTKFKYRTKTYYLSGKKNSLSTEGKPVVDFKACTDLVKGMILPLVIPKPMHLNETKITAASYFIHRSIKSGIVPESGGVATVGQFQEKAKQFCDQATADQPFMCLDLVYISTLLTDGYGLSVDNKIHLYRRINDRRISWALGYAYSSQANISRKLLMN